MSDGGKSPAAEGAWNTVSEKRWGEEDIHLEGTAVRDNPKGMWNPSGSEEDMYIGGETTRLVANRKTETISKGAEDGSQLTVRKGNRN